MVGQKTVQIKPLAGRRSVLLFSAIRGIGVVVAVLAAFTGAPLWCWLSLPFLLITLWVSALILVNYWKNLYRLPRLEAPPSWPADKAWPAVALVVSARNEQLEIESAVRTFMASDYPNLTVVMVDDHSTDDTPAILDRLSGEFPTLCVIHNPPYQEGWGGKGNAISHTVHHVLGEDCKWVITTDADVKFAPGAVRAAVAHAEALGVDYFTCMPRYEPKLLSEELILITSSWDVPIAAAFYRPKGVFRGVGLGPFAMFTREIYVRSGGHAPFKARSPEDTNLAGVIRDAGGKMAVGWTSGLVRFRHYVGYEDVKRITITKARVYQYDSIFAAFSLFMQSLIVSVLPLPLGIAALALNPLSFPVAVYATLNLATYLTETARVLGQRSFIDIRGFIPWIHPLGGLMRMWFGVITVWQILTKKDFAWRGRAYWKRPAT